MYRSAGGGLQYLELCTSLPMPVGGGGAWFSLNPNLTDPADPIFCSLHIKRGGGGGACSCACERAPMRFPTTP